MRRVRPHRAAGRRQRGALGPRRGAAHQSRFVMDAPPGTRFLEPELVRQGDGGATAATRSRCTRVGPDGPLVKKIRNWRANRNCAKTDRGNPDLPGRRHAGRCRSTIAGATRIVQRAVCVGGSRKRFCSARSINDITDLSGPRRPSLDLSPPAVAHRAGQPLHPRRLGQRQPERHLHRQRQRRHQDAPRPSSAATRVPSTIGHATTPAPIPCTNDPGQIQVDTAKLARGNAAAAGAGGRRGRQRGRLRSR